MISFQNVTYVMLLPSTVLTGLLIYVVHKKSPPIMSGYKYVIMFTCLTVYQFDLIDALLIPKIIPRIAALEFHGLLGLLFPLEGNSLLTLFVCSIIISGLSLLISFVWREYSLLKFNATKLSVALQVFHLLCAAIPFAGIFPMFNRIFLDRSDYIDFMNLVGAPYDPKYAIFVAVNDKIQNFIEFFVYAFCVAVICSTFVFKAVYRIRKEVHKPRQCISPNTIRMHKMLLRSLIWQVLAPISIFVLPIIVVVSLSVNNLPQKFGISEADVRDFNSQAAAIILTIPSIYTSVHVSLVIYFTTPYRQFVGKYLSGRRSSVSTQAIHLEVVDSVVVKQQRHSLATI